jgi:hypothetical protein
MWVRIVAHCHKVLTSTEDETRMAPGEAAFFRDVWLEDNTPYDAKARWCCILLCMPGALPPHCWPRLSPRCLQAMDGKAGAVLQQSKRDKFRWAVIVNLLLIMLQVIAVSFMRVGRMPLGAVRHGSSLLTPHVSSCRACCTRRRCLR